MIKVTCQYTGIEFEAESKRTKNHPMVAEFLNEASSNRFQTGAYRKAKDILAEAKGQFESIDDLMNFAKAAYAEYCNDGTNNIKVRTYKQILAAAKAEEIAAAKNEDHMVEIHDIFGPDYYERHVKNS